MNGYITEPNTPPKFLEGDEVEFEVVMVAGSALPRWDANNVDRGKNKANPLMAKGEVEMITPDYIYIKYNVDGLIGTGKCLFPNYDNKDYSSWQWSRQNYLKKINKNICSCGAEKVKTTHSNWCDKYQKFKKKFK